MVCSSEFEAKYRSTAPHGCVISGKAAKVRTYRIKHLIRVHRLLIAEIVK
jgi:hypothetical protein